MTYIRLNIPQGNPRLTSGSLKIACLVLALIAATAITSSAQTLTTLVDFDYTNGAYPLYGSLVLGSDGNYYGTTWQGGAYNFGSVFEVTPTGTLTTVYSFCSEACADGGFPYGGLVLGSDGNLYGTTAEFGANELGTIFEITPTGTFSVLYNFCSEAGCADGGLPLAGLTYYNGVLYGTTSYGGTKGAGTIFSITTAGAFKVLYNFCSQTNCSDGGTVFGSLVRAANGKFYGVTSSGGANGWGTVFAITTAGKLTTLYNFCATAYCPDGAGPYSTLIQGSNGELYGTTYGGGTGFRGTIFEITTAGALTTLHSFSGTDGANPYAGLVQGSNGDFYGTTYSGGNLSCTVPPGGCGTVFSLAP